MNVPADLLYTEHDEWVRIEGDIATIGITDFAQDQLGELVHVELPEVGTSFDVGDAACEVESVKAVAEVYAPLAGEVVAVNDAVADEAEQINGAPYDAWLFKLRIGGGADTSGLMGADAYAGKIAG